MKLPVAFRAMMRVPLTTITLVEPALIAAMVSSALAL
jgi:hypothetical protein